MLTSTMHFEKLIFLVVDFPGRDITLIFQNNHSQSLKKTTYALKRELPPRALPYFPLLLVDNRNVDYLQIIMIIIMKKCSIKHLKTFFSVSIAYYVSKFLRYGM